MASNTVNQPADARGEPRHTAPVTNQTLLQDGGQAAKKLMLQCTYEVEAMCHVMVDLVDQFLASPLPLDYGLLGHKLRAAAAHIDNRNGLLMSFLSADSVTLEGAASQLMTVVEAAKEANNG